MSRYYGCGLVALAPQMLEGMRILDLGSGSGRDCYVLSQLVGESGYVIGVDMTDEQLNVANRHIEYHRKKFGYAALFAPHFEFYGCWDNHFGIFPGCGMSLPFSRGLYENTEGCC